MKPDLKAWEVYRVEPGVLVRLAHMPTDATDVCPDKHEARRLLKHYGREIGVLAQTLAAESKRALLVVLQGVDAAGKDGAIRNVFSGIDPQICRATAFKEPEGEEKAHDFLWRIVRALPARGQIGVFNRSHYEDVLVPRVHAALTRAEARARLAQIADAERTWATNGTVICKVLLHISRAEQTRRFRARLDTPEKHWKLDASDFADRRHWERFRATYEQAIESTATRDAPWYVLPADHKWYRDAALAAVVLRALRAVRPRLPMPRIDAKQFKL